MCAVTYAAITNALAQVYAQCRTPAERLYVRRALGEVAIEAFDYEYAIQLLRPAGEEAVPDDRAALDEYALNLHTAATRIYGPLCQFSDTVRIYEHLMRMTSDMAKAYGYSRLAAHVARTDVRKARALLAEGRTQIDPAASWYRMLDNMEAALEGLHAFHQNPATRELTPESARELARLQREVFFNVPGARERLQLFHAHFTPHLQKP